MYDLLAGEDCTIREVKYDLDKMDLDDFLQQFYIYSDGPIHDDADEMFFHKRKCFAYEDELRLLINPEKLPDNKQIYYHPITAFEEFIDGVMVHPLANKEYVALIEMLCKQFNIPFWGQSEIYNFRPL